MSTSASPNFVQLGFQRADLRSSMLEYAEFLAAEDLLRIRFVNGDMYEYHNVPEGKFKEMCKADSQGRYFTMYIKDVYPTFKLVEV